MYNNKESWKPSDVISVTMSHDALMNLITGINGARPTEKPPQQQSASKCKLCIGIEEDSDTCLCCGQDEPICATVTAAAREDRTRTVQIKACPSYFIVY